MTILFCFVSTSLSFASPITSENLINLINQERTSRNIAPLSSNDELNNAADLKSNDMINRDYFDHYAFGLSPWDFISNSGYDYLYAGENLAMDFQTSEGMVNAWMNSTEHRENILNPNFTDIGIGVVKGEYTENDKTRDTVVVTNIFGRQKPPILKLIDTIRNFFNRKFF